MNDKTLDHLRIASLLLLGTCVACSDDVPADSASDTGTTDDTAGDGDGDGDGEPSPECGDGKVDPGEECDDGNDNNSDMCVEGCLNASCGDGFKGIGEGCDDGNMVDDDACDNSCTPTGCGDGNVDPGEECDDGNADNTDDCLDTCAAPSCGDGYVWAGNETCDDANMDNTDDCLDTCEAPSCGDGYVWAGNEACDDANMDNTDDCLDTCEASSCGDGFVWAGNEDCDDANMQNSDGCEDDCTVTVGAMKIVHGYEHTCALFWTGEVRCWGDGGYGQLGYGNTLDIGNNEPANTVGFVDLGGTAVDLAAGYRHNCAVLDDASLVCWGANDYGQLGYASTGQVGDSESPAVVGAVDVGDNVVAVSLGSLHSCVLTDQQTVRCWGYNARGQLGQGNTTTIGDTEHPYVINAISLGDDAIDMWTGSSSTCALLAGGGVRCWGDNNFGQLGYGHTNDIGDNEVPSSAPTVPLGNTPVVDMAIGGLHTCVLYDDGNVRCWGYNSLGQLGYGNTTTIGDNETPPAVGTVDVGASVDEIWASAFNTCVRMGTNVKCWGEGSPGINGTANTMDLGDNEVPSSFANIDVGFNVSALGGAGVGSKHICALSGIDLRCWGNNGAGQLGYGHTNSIGDNELPSSYGLVPYM
jgi:cysteine-rich repeat protein